MPSVTFNRLKPDDKSRLKRLKLSLWVLTIVFVSHGMFGAFPEIFPITRWAMFSESHGRPVEPLKQIVRFRVEVTTVGGEQFLLKDSQLANLFGFNTLRYNLIRYNLQHIATNPDLSHQSEAIDFIMELLKKRYDDTVVQFDIYEYVYIIDYDRHPSIDYTTADSTGLLASVRVEDKSVQRFWEEEAGD